MPRRCRYCNGNMHLERVVPGAFDVKCIMCSRSAGMIFADELVAKGASQNDVKRAEQSVPGCAFLWERAS